MDSRSTLASPQRGAATVVVMLGLLAVLALGLLFANRGLLLESRMSANQARATVAFETAEAGLAWVLAQGPDVVPIPGTKRRAYLEENVGALAVRLTPADLRRIDEVAPRDAAAGPRYPEFMMRFVNA